MTDEIIELYKRDLDMTLIREQLKRTPTERLQYLMELQKKAAADLEREGKSIP